MTVKIITFEEALEIAGDTPKPHLLLGNGFSIACRPDIFVYGKLFDRADFSKLSSSAQKSFEALQTTDFEKVIRALRDASLLLDVYEGIPEEAKIQMQQDADGLREVLVKAIASSHPEFPGAISEEEFAKCRSFIKNFKTVYTLNYDLLLYWTQMHVPEGESPSADDGFRKPEDEFEIDYVTWEPHQSHDQNTWYLHGALHVFDAGTEIQKYTWVNTGIRLIDQVRDALKKNYFPLFVAEGTSKEKLERVRHSDYLAKAYRSFSEIGGSLFVYGHSLAPNDDHYLGRIEQGKIRKLFVGLHGDPASVGNKAIVKRALSMPNRRRRKPNLEVYFYDTDTASVWR
jgi:hypothetical protein